jgi:hypothetical protein
MLSQQGQKGSNMQAPVLAFSKAQVYDFLHLDSHCSHQTI